MKALRWVLLIITIVGLAIDAYIHLKVASDYDTVGDQITEGQLFRFEAVLAIVAAVVLAIRPNRWTAGFAALVAGGGTVALLVYYFVNVGAIGPLPNMHESVFFAEKTITLVAQAVATVTALALVVLGWPRVNQDASSDVL